MTRDDTLVAAANWVLGITWGAVFFVVLTASLGDHPARPGVRVNRAVLFFMPEGWAFFTKSPHEPDDYLYRWYGPDSLVASGAMNGDPRFGFGLRKTPRLQMLELALLVEPVPKGRWRPCENGLQACLTRLSLPVTEVRNHSVMRYLCGKFLVVRQPPVPWAWRRLRGRVHMPAKLLLLDAKCPARREATT